MSKYPMKVGVSSGGCYYKYAPDGLWVFIQCDLPPKVECYTKEYYERKQRMDAAFEQVCRSIFRNRRIKRITRQKQALKSLLGNVVVATICLSLAAVGLCQATTVTDNPLLHQFRCLTSTGIFSFISALHMFYARKAYDNYDSTLN